MSMMGGNSDDGCCALKKAKCSGIMIGVVLTLVLCGVCMHHKMMRNKTMFVKRILPQLQKGYKFDPYVQCVMVNGSLLYNQHTTVEQDRTSIELVNKICKERFPIGK